MLLLTPYKRNTHIKVAFLIDLALTVVEMSEETARSMHRESTQVLSGTDQELRLLKRVLSVTVRASEIDYSTLSVDICG